MLGIGFSELMLIAVVGLVVIGPKDLPVLVRHIAKFMHEMRSVYSGLKGQMHELMEESGIHDIKREMNTIIDLDGKPQQAFDISELDAMREKPKSDA